MVAINRKSKMFRRKIYFRLGTDVREGDRITVDEERYRVLSVSRVEGRALLQAVVEPWEANDGAL